MTTVAATWGTDVVAASFAGHPGLVYEPRPRSLVELLAASARFGEREFLVQGERRVTFDAFRHATAHGVSVLRSHGVQPGGRVLVLGFNSPAWVLALWSAWVAGAVPVLGNRWWSDEERAAAIELVRPSTIVGDDPSVDETAAPLLPLDVLDGCFDCATEPHGPGEPDGPGELDAAVDGSPDPDEDAEALVLFTSGSSGRAKAVRLSHRSVLANQHNLLLRARRLPHQQSLDDPQTVTLVSVPLFHIGGVTNLVTQVVAGGRLVFLRGRFDPAEVLELIERERVTSWGGVPTMARRVLEHPSFAERDLSSLRSFPLGGAPVPSVLLDQARERLPQLARGLAATWGLSESGGFLTLANAADLVERPGTVGRPYPVVEIQVLDPDADGAGELLVRSPTVMLGYVGQEDGTDDGTVDGDGFLHTGDVGRYEDGYVYVTGRSKDMVIRGGENVACPHVEAVLLRHPEVREAAVLGVPHDDLGEELVATVVLRSGSTAGIEELRAHAATSLAYFEIPTRWRFTTEPLPVLPTGKVDKQALRAEHLGSGA